ncbi:MAG: DUF5688 family protein [Blautia sp.]
MMKEKIKYQLINYEKNESMLQTLPHIRYLDLAIVFYSEIEEEDGLPYGLLTWRGLESLDMSMEELEDLAAANTPREMPFQLEKLETLVKKLLGDQYGEQKGGRLPMYVLTNERRLFGAACILYPGLLEWISRKFSSDLYILPSSIHECILIPVGKGASQEQLQKIVQEINGTQVPEDEILSDHVYIYRQEGDAIIF